MTGVTHVAFACSRRVPQRTTIRKTPALVLVVAFVSALVAVARGADAPSGKSEPRDAHPAQTPKAAPAPSGKVAPGPPPGPAVPLVLAPAPIVTGCRLDRRLFRSFTAGVVDYCRGHLDYVPGALDCYTFVDEVCSLYTPASGEWGESRRQGLPEVFPCPDDVQPPVCPRFIWH